MKCYAKFCTVLLLPAAFAAGCASQPAAQTTSVATAAEPGSEAVRATIEIQGLRDELARLRNEIELQRNQLDNLTRRQRELYDDLDYRLRQRERAAGGITLTQPPSGTLGSSNTGSGFQSAPTGGSADSSVMTGTEANTGSAAGSAIDTTIASIPSTGQSPSISQPQAAIAAPEEQAKYDEAFNQLKRSQYGESVTAFQQQLALFPNGALADDAQYWIGEAMYVTRDFQGGLRAFQTVVDLYPESPRVAEAMLKLGYIQYEVGAKEDARQTLTQVVNRFPGSRVAISAQTRLRKLQSEGIGG